jgi:hypothetical protein
MESATTFEARGEVWLYPGDAGWHFVTLPPDLADETRARQPRHDQAPSAGHRPDDRCRAAVKVQLLDGVERLLERRA